MVGDVTDVVGVQAQIERMQHAARAWDREIGFEVRVVVPHQRRDAIALLEPGRLQRAAKRERAAVKIADVVTMQRLVGQPRHDFRCAE
jgi:hypothetical protein